ncbi:hypothetical protein [Flavobacterium tistrianum]|uniref:hypothetical protein n=1 Tax=Flavobacterium tistrianum TaxID=1685414 RepID=UPI000DAB7603|nr:hypothetical protein [Flavobacterium tistrianum]KAF2343141.1 hypothetical protein DMB71_00125 [Flavobacterium tistrianum]
MEKEWKKAIKKLAQLELLRTFAPATAKNALRHSGSFTIFEGRNFQKKRFEKACGKRKSFLHLHPANTGSFLRD